MIEQYNKGHVRLITTGRGGVWEGLHGRKELIEITNPQAGLIQSFRIEVEIDQGRTQDSDILEEILNFYFVPRVADESPETMAAALLALHEELDRTDFGLSALFHQDEPGENESNNGALFEISVPLDKMGFEQVDSSCGRLEDGPETLLGSDPNLAKATTSALRETFRAATLKFFQQNTRVQLAMMPDIGTQLQAIPRESPAP